MRKRIDAPILRSIFWCITLVFVLLFWPRETLEPEVIVETKIVYVYLSNELDVYKDLDLEFGDNKDIKEPEEPPRYGFTDDDIYLMTVLLCGSENTDGDGEYDIDFDKNIDNDQVSLVLSVVMNRVMSDKFPNTVSEVIWGPGQFSPMPKWRKGLPSVSDKSYQIVKKWCEAYDSNDLSVMSIPENHLYFSGNGVVNRSRKGF